LSRRRRLGYFDVYGGYLLQDREGVSIQKLSEKINNFNEIALKTGTYTFVSVSHFS